MSYATEVAADTPVAHYKLDETAGTTATDSGSAKVDGTYAGTYALDQEGAGGGVGNTGRSVLLNSGGTNGEVVTGAFTGFPSTDLTAEFWVNIHTLDGNQMFLCYGNAAFARAFAFYHITTQIGFSLNGTNFAFSLDLDSTENRNNWHHIVLTWRNSDGQMRVWHNGLLAVDATGLAVGQTIADGGSLLIGQEWAAAGSPPSGRVAGFDLKAGIDEVAIYNAVLTPARIVAHYVAGLTPELLDVPAPVLGAAGSLVVIPITELIIPDIGGGGGGAPDPLIVQRIWDTNVGWCQYTKATFDPAPLVAETEPNHTNNLIVSTHQKIGEAPA